MCSWGNNEERNKENMMRPSLLYKALTDTTWGKMQDIVQYKSQVKQILTFVQYKANIYKIWDIDYNNHNKKGLIHKKK